jgi:peptidoglycan/LPS O-acetylase OafA/YrhL
MQLKRNEAFAAGVDTVTQSPSTGAMAVGPGVPLHQAEPSPHTKYRADIDGLRAISVLSVVTFHAFPNSLRGGFIGVDIFFVISGFLISTIIFTNLERDSFSFVDFYSRRIKRIFPALLLVLIASAAFGWFALLADEYKQLGKHIAGGAGFVANFMFWNESGYFDEAASTKPLLHLWSLGIEEQFYILWPPLLWFTWKQRLNPLTVIILIVLLSFALNIANIHGNAIAAFYSPQTRFWELLAGSLLAYTSLYKPNMCPQFTRSLDARLGAIIYAYAPEANGDTLRNAQALFGAALIAVGILSITEEQLFPGWWAVLPTLGAVLIIAAGTQAWLNRTVLSTRILVWFGLISFPLYLWHWPLLSFARIMESETPALGIRIVAVLLSILFAWLSYELLEKPIRFSTHSKAKTITLLVLMIVVGFVGYHGYRRDGLIFGATKPGKSIRFDGPYPHPRRNQSCTNLFPLLKEFNACVLSKAAKPDIAIVGDSHSNHFYQSLAKMLPDKSVMNLAAFSCLPFTTQTLHQGYRCQGKADLLMTFLLTEESIKTVYVAGYWSYLAAGGFSVNLKDGGYRLARPLTPKDSVSFQAAGESFLAHLLAAKKEVIFIRDIPDLDFNPSTCLDSRPLRITKKMRSPCAMEKAEYEKRISNHDSSLSALLSKFPGLKVFDPKPIFCDSKLCWAMKNNQPLYQGNDHLSIYGADLVVKELLSQYPVP